MLDTSKLTKEEMQLIQDALTLYEQRNGDQKEKSQKILSIVSMFEAAARRTGDNEQTQQFLGMMEQLKTEMVNHSREEESTARVERERITLLKAKLILAAQGKAVDKFLSDSLGSSDESDSD